LAEEGLSAKTISADKRSTWSSNWQLALSKI